MVNAVRALPCWCAKVSTSGQDVFIVFDCSHVNILEYRTTCPAKFDNAYPWIPCRSVFVLSCTIDQRPYAFKDMEPLCSGCWIGPAAIKDSLRGASSPSRITATRTTGVLVVLQEG